MVPDRLAPLLDETRAIAERERRQLRVAIGREDARHRRLDDFQARGIPTMDQQVDTFSF